MDMNDRSIYGRLEDLSLELKDLSSEFNELKTQIHTAIKALKWGSGLLGFTLFLLGYIYMHEGKNKEWEYSAAQHPIVITKNDKF